MRGAGDQLTIGERVAFYRVRRGLTQAELAGLVGRGPDWLGKIERGERALRNVDVLAGLSTALRVTLGDLIGHPALAEDDQANDDVPAIRDALMAPGRLSRMLYTTSRDDTVVDVRTSSRLVEFAWLDDQRGRLGEVTARLPALIRAGQHLEDAAGVANGNQARLGWAVSASAHHLAATALSKLGEADLSWIAAERAMQAADRSEDVLVLASSARAATHALLAVGRFDDAVALGRTAATWLREQVADDNPAALSLLGMLHLRTAVAAARNQDRPAATELLDLADAAATSLGADADHWHTSFGPTNVAVHRVSAALDLADVRWAAEKGVELDVKVLPRERRATHLADVARAHADLADDERALILLLRAERDAPGLVRHSAAVRETVKTLCRRAPVTAGARSSELGALARRCRALR